MEEISQNNHQKELIKQNQFEEKDQIKVQYFSYQQKLNPKLYTLFRLDGHSFSKFVKQFKMDKPFDKNFTTIMKNTALQNILYFKFAFGFVGSDQITFCMKPLTQENIKKNGTLEFGGRIEKMVSLLAGKVSTTFFMELTKIYGLQITQNFYPHFDCRVFQVKTFQEAIYNINQRIVFTLKNARMMLAQHHFSQKQLNNVPSKLAVQKLKQQKGIDFEETVSADNRVGSFISFKKESQTKQVLIKGKEQTITFERRVPIIRNLGPSEILKIKQEQII